MGGRTLGNVSRGNDACSTDCKPTQYAPKGKIPDREGKPGANGTDGKQDRSYHHCLDSTITVGDFPGIEGSDRRSQQCQRYCKTSFYTVSVKSFGESCDRTVDYRSIKTEQKATEGSSTSNQDDI